VCTPLPAARDLGTVTVHGLVMPVQMTPNARTKSYSNPTTPRLPHPGFESGADLRITTGGGDYEPFELRGWGISPLSVTTDPIIVAPGMATSISWEVPPEAGPAHVLMDLVINKHGSSEARIECDFPDTGSAQIPAALIDALFEKGLSGFPTLTLTRRTATSEIIEPGCVELLVTSGFSTGVEVPGLTSCDDANPCPTGQTCVPVMLVCE
jgi:hypothetical protein